MFPLRDDIGNSGTWGPPSQYDNLVQVANWSGDTTAPQLRELTVTPDVYYAGDTDASLTVRARITDDASGVRSPGITIASDPDATESYSSLTPMTLISGTATDGYYEWSGTLDVGSIDGDWSASIEGLEDVRGNVTTNIANASRSFTVDLGKRPIAPSAPQSVKATPGNASAVVTWQAPSAVGSSPITEYVVTAAPGGAEQTVAATATSATVSGLTNGTAYRFTVTAVNAAGTSVASEPSAAATPRTVAGAPTDVVATAGDASATVEWAAPASDGGATISAFEVSVEPGDTVVEVSGTETSASFSDLDNGTEYTFTVVAINAAGSSPASEPTAAVTPLEPLEPLARFAGSDRYATAAAIAEQFPVGVETVYIASGTNFPDALAGAARAGAEDVPVLLARHGAVPQPTIDALERLQPQRIVLLGGTPTLSTAVEQALREFGTVSRIAGENRYATAAEISEGFVPGVDTVFVASGRDFPDALAGAALAGALGAPVLLTSPTSLPDSVATALGRLNPDDIVILGGTPSVSALVATALAEHGDTRRIAGANRYETAALVAAEFDGAQQVFVASGQKFPDALAGAALAGAQGAPVLLARPTTLPDSTADAVQRLQPQQVVVLGDASSISDHVAAELLAAAK